MADDHIMHQIGWQAGTLKTSINLVCKRWDADYARGRTVGVPEGSVVYCVGIAPTLLSHKYRNDDSSLPPNTEAMPQMLCYFPDYEEYGYVFCRYFKPLLTAQDKMEATVRTGTTIS